MRGLVILSAAVCVVFSACGEAPESAERGPDAARELGIAGLVARLVAEPVDDRGHYALSIPFEDPIRLALRITNVGDEPMQVPRSSFPFHYFFKLEIERVEDDGTRTQIPFHGDLYPMKDMMMPDLEYVTLRPGESIERSMAVLIREAYCLETYFGSTGFSHYDDLRKQGLGTLREGGTFEVRGRYSSKPTSLVGKPHDFFEDRVGRDETLPIWPGPVVESQTLTLQVTPNAD